MNKKFTIELPDIQPKQTKDIIKELQENINMQLKVLRDISEQTVLADLQYTQTVLKDVESLIDECYLTSCFKSLMYEKFSNLVFEYQRLSIRLESAVIEEKIEELDQKTITLEKKTLNFEGSLKEILGTLVGIFLTFTLLPAAITGITMIDGRFIIPFVATLILFGIIMITFIYVINHVEINKNVKWIIRLLTTLVIFLWCVACFSNFDISIKEEEKQNEINNFTICN